MLDSDSLVSSFYDAVVIGSGPAGCVAARCLALGGAKTLLVDKAEFPRAKVCGGCLSPRAVAALERLGLGGTLEGAGEARALRVIWGERSARMIVPRRVIVDRAVFDLALARAAADAGVDSLSGCRAQRLQDGSILVRFVSGFEQSVGAKVVIVADGLAGTALRGDARFAWRVKAMSAVGMGAVVPAGDDRSWDDEIVMSCSEHGYAGVATLDDGRRVVAGAARGCGTGGAGGSLDSLLGSMAVGMDFSRGVRGVPQLTRTRDAVEADGRVLVIGDAAGYVEPFTGEGMAWAIEHAEMVVGFAQEILAGSYVPGAWEAHLRRTQRRQQRVCRVVSGVLRRPRVGSMVVGAVDAFPAWGEAIAELVDGSYATAGGVR